jgi:transposase-like protein
MPINCTPEKLKEYNKKAYEKGKDTKIKCNICNKEYTIFTKSNHIKSQYHKTAHTYFILNDQINNLQTQLIINGLNTMGLGNP